MMYCFCIVCYYYKEKELSLYREKNGTLDTKQRPTITESKKRNKAKAIQFIIITIILTAPLKLKEDRY
ncbi:unnamed protein product [Camellia sinensis]